MMILQKTKLLLPACGTDVLPRLQLMDALNDDCLLHLIIAPAGYGKTTLVSQWATDTDCKVAWLSLDADDNLASQFIRYFVAALQTHIQSFDISDVIDFDANHSEILIALSNTLIEQITQPICVVLDNYQVIHDAIIHEIVDFFLCNPVPNLRFILLSRTEPPLSIARLRALQQIHEICTERLALNQDEMAVYFEQAHVALTSEQVAQIHDKTGGWLAGLQFLKLRLNNSENVEKIIDDFSGKDAFVADYLESEVLSRFDDDTQLFVIQSSILDTLSGELCDAIMQREGSHEKLATLQKQGLLLISMDTDRIMYRYHPLMRDFLLAHLANSSKNDVSILHRRASDWIASYDDLTIQHMTRLLYHASQVNQTTLLNHLEQCATALLKQGYDYIVLKYTKNIRFEALYEYPVLIICYLWALYGNGQASLAQQLLPQVESILPESVQGDVRALQAQFSIFENNPRKSRELTVEALLELSPEDVITRALMHHNLGRISFFDDGQTEDAITLLTQSVQVYEQIEHHALWAIAMDLLIAIRQRHGSLLEAEALCRYSIARCEYLDRMDFAGAFYSQLGKILYERNHLVEATEILRRGRNFSRQYDGMNSFLAGSLTLARIVNHEERTDILNDLRKFAGTDAYQLMRIAAYPVSTLAEHGWLAPRVDWQKQDFDKQIDVPDIQSVYTFLNVARMLCLGLNPQFRKAITLLMQLESLTTQMQHKSSLIEVLILLSVAYEMTGNRKAALPALRKAVLLAQQTGHYRIFVDSGDIVLSLLDMLAHQERNPYALRFVQKNPGHNPRQLQPPLTQSLTRREVEILHLLSQGYSNPEISTHCSISVTTTRWHVRNIYRKLEVDNRTRATVRARNLGLI